MNGKIALVIPVVLMLAACGTAPVKLADAKAVPANRLYITDAPTSNDGTAIVIRDTGFEGSGCGIMVSLDKKPAAMIGSGEKASFSVPAGPHILTAMPSNRGLCKLGHGRQARSLPFSAQAGVTTTFRVGVSAAGDPVFYQSSL